MAQPLSDFPSGPLDVYRKKASFDWKKLRVFLDTEEILDYLNELYGELQQHPILFPQNLQTPVLDEVKRLAVHKVYTLHNVEKLTPASVVNNLRKPMAALTTLCQLDPAATIKRYIPFAIFPSVINALGTDRHLHYLENTLQGDILGAYCLTEIGHGSNAKFMQTTATYDRNSQEFVLHTPNFKATKCWAGLLGNRATHAVVYAQLITPDGVQHGLHAFVAKIRDPETFLPYSGITVGDMGEKIGLNGIDNGFLMFNQYRIPRIDLLNKTGDVTEDGRYVSPYQDPNKRHGATLGSLSVGRVVITGVCSTYMAHALTIAIRYAAVRKQFGPDEKEEWSILEYQSHQYRLIPYLSVAYVLKNFASYLMVVQWQFIADSMHGENKNTLTDLGLELHAISSAAKPVCGWVVRDGIQKCREACAGHGYLKIAGIGEIKNAHDANCTYEGENHVLIQQTSNWLLKFWPLILRGQSITSPLQSVDFLTNARPILTNKCNVNTVREFTAPNNMLNMYQWLVCYLLKISYEKYEKLSHSEKLDSFSAKNNTQVFYLKNLATAYIEHIMLQRMFLTIAEATDPQIKDVLSRLLSLYGAFSMEKHVATFYQGGYAVGGEFTSLVQDSILMLCRSLKDDSVALIDVIAPPDFLIQSALGRSDGQVYKHLEDAMVHAAGALDRPNWWKEIVDLKDTFKAKL